MHILHLSTNCNIGGVGNVIIPMIKRLQNEDVRFSVAYLKKPDSLKKEYNNLGVDTHFIGTNPIRVFIRLFRLSRNSEFPFTHIHTHLVHASLVGRIFGKLSGIPIMTTRHYHKRSKRFDPLYLLEDLTQKFSDLTVAISQAVKDHIERSKYVPSEKCRVIYNPVEMDLFGNHERIDLASRGHIVCNARWIKIKGIEFLLDAFEHIGSQIPEAALILIGRTDNAHSIKQKINDHPYCERINVKGFIPRDKIIMELSKARIYVQPSLLEGLGLSAIEAMGMKVPCIFSDTGGLSELAYENNNAELVPPGNSKLLGEKIISLWKNIDRSLELGSNAQQFVAKHFDADLISKQYFNAYKQLIKE